MSGAGLRSLAISFPKTVLTNDHWKVHYPEVVATAEQRSLARLWAAKDEGAAATEPFDIEMEPYLSDPFRGARERRVLLPGETTLSIQVDAAKKALAAAQIAPADIEVTLVSTFLPELLDVGNAVFVARDVGLGGTAVNMESACASSVAGLEMACAMIKGGGYERILVVTACRYSHVIDEADTLSWFLADGAGAFVVTKAPEGEGVIGFKSVHTAESCGVLSAEIVVDPKEGPRVRVKPMSKSGQMLRDASATYLPICCAGAAEKAGVKLEDISLFVFNTPTAWYHKFAARTLGIDPERTLSTYAEYGNIGPALMPANLHRAATTGRLKRGDLVMLYAIGSLASASAVVMRWGDVGLGPA